MEKPLEVVGLDSYSGHDFVVYFSDETYATMTATKLAECFPDRAPIVIPEDLGLTEDETAEMRGDEEAGG